MEGSRREKKRMPWLRLALCLPLLVTVLWTGCTPQPVEFVLTVSHYDPLRAYDGITHISTLWRYTALLSSDMQGEQRWFYNDRIPTSLDVTSDNHVISLVNTTPTILDKDTGEFLWQAVAGMYGGHHYCSETPWGTVVLLKGTQTNTGYEPWGDCLVMNDYIVEINMDAEVLWEWKLIDHVDPVEHHWPDMCETGNPTEDWSHCNTVRAYENYVFNGHTYDRVILLGSRNLSTFWMIDYNTGNILFSCGVHGEIGSTTPPEEPLFSWAHDVDLMDNGNFIMFDNGATRADLISRGLEIHVDTAAGTAEEVWSWTDPDEVMYSNWGGDAARLPNGNTLVTSPMGSKIIEVTDEGEKVWQLTLRHKLYPDPVMMITSIYKAVRVGAEGM